MAPNIPDFVSVFRPFLMQEQYRLECIAVCVWRLWMVFGRGHPFVVNDDRVMFCSMRSSYMITSLIMVVQWRNLEKEMAAEIYRCTK